MYEPEDKNRLPADVAAKAGANLGEDFSNVTVHEDGEAEKLGTRAFARGNQLHFAAGQYRPGSPDGVALIGHELAHVAQQRDGRVAANATAKGVAVNTDPGLEAEADAGGAAVAQGFDLGGFLDFGAPAGAAAAREVTAPVAQGSDIEPDAKPDAEPAADAEPLELADVLGDDYESTRDAQEEDYWEAYQAASDIVGPASAKAPRSGAVLDGELTRSNELPGEIRMREEAVLAAAQRGTDGKVTGDKAASTALWATRDKLDAYTELLLAEAHFWQLYLALPMLEGMAKVWEGWVNWLKQFDETCGAAFSSRLAFDRIYHKWHEELVEAEAKAGIDLLSIFADLLLWTAPVSGPVGFGCGIAVAGVGTAMGWLMEPDEGLSVASVQPATNFTLTVADLARQLKEIDPKDLTYLHPENIALLQSKGFATGKPMIGATLSTVLKSLSTAIDVGTFTKDAAEVKMWNQMLSELTEALNDWNAKYGKMMEVWPMAVQSLTAAEPFLERLQAALAASGPMLDAARAEVYGARSQLATLK